MGQKGRLDALTSLRWFAAFAVLLRHVGQTNAFPAFVTRHGLNQGVIGVSFFFVLSGFVLTWSRSDNDTSAAFYQRRFARLYPAYAVACLLMVALFVSNHSRLGAKEWFSFSALQAFVPGWHFALNGVSWSLSCELFFYAMFPLALPRLVKLSLRDRRIVMALCACVPFVVAAPLTHSPLNSDAQWLYYCFPPVRFAEFVIGMLLALEVRDRTWPIVKPSVAAAVAAAGYLVAGLVPERFMWVGIAPVPFAILIGSIAQSEATSPIRVLHWRPLIWLGEVSFCFYLVHMMTLFWLGDHMSTQMSIALVLPVALAIASGLHYAVERPCERWLRPSSARPSSARPSSARPSSQPSWVQPSSLAP